MLPRGLRRLGRRTGPSGEKDWQKFAMQGRGRKGVSQEGTVGCKRHRFDSWVGKIPWRRAYSILAWRISWTEEPGGLQSTELQSQT